MSSDKLSTKKAFGIAEVLIASTIIVMIVFALTAAGRSSLRAAIYLHQRAQATYLAQEGIETLRQVRDSNWIDATPGTGWSSFDLTSMAAKDYPKDGSGNTYSKLAFDDAAKRFKVAGLDSIEANITPELINIDDVDFKRTVVFSRIAKDQSATLLPTDNTSASTQKSTSVQADINAIKATIKVTWDNNGQKEITMSEIITNWRPDY